AYIHDRTAATLPHPRQSFSCAVISAIEVDSKDAPPLLWSDLSDRAKNSDPRIVYKHRYRFSLFVRKRKQSSNRFRIRHVGYSTRDTSACVAKLCQRRIDFLLFRPA